MEAAYSGDACEADSRASTTPSIQLRPNPSLQLQPFAVEGNHHHPVHIGEIAYDHLEFSIGLILQLRIAPVARELLQADIPLLARLQTTLELVNEDLTGPGN